ncbi:MAG: hypothetical protein JWM80_975 [Cyanobacteria bacterium RYN_339]|nr:hypothetical protein [Cyanobacteria bacterium RYN_339]
MFHAVNGDSLGNLKVTTSAIPTPLPDSMQGNKGDRGYSDQTEARVFLIGNPASDRHARSRHGL